MSDEVFRFVYSLGAALVVALAVMMGTYSWAGRTKEEQKRDGRRFFVGAFVLAFAAFYFGDLVELRT